MQSNQFNENFTNYLKEKNNLEAEEHQSSGKISPSKITKPTLEAVLSLLGVPSDPPSDQGLRYFLRGNILEEVGIKAITFGRPSGELQVEATYRNAIGYIDCYLGVPHEIKSAGVSTWGKVKKHGKPLNSHCIQATYYALAKDTKYSWVHYVNTDTFQIISHRVEADEYKDEVDRRISGILACLMARLLPDYEPLDDLHKTIMFCEYKMFYKKTGEEAENILKEFYPDQYKLLKSGTVYERIKE